MTLHTARGTRQSVKQDDGYGNLIPVGYPSLISRLLAGWKEL